MKILSIKIIKLLQHKTCQLFLSSLFFLPVFVTTQNSLNNGIDNMNINKTDTILSINIFKKTSSIIRERIFLYTVIAITKLLKIAVESNEINKGLFNM